MLFATGFDDSVEEWLDEQTAQLDLPGYQDDAADELAYGAAKIAAGATSDWKVYQGLIDNHSEFAWGLVMDTTMGYDVMLKMKSKKGILIINFLVSENGKPGHFEATARFWPAELPRPAMFNWVQAGNWYRVDMMGGAIVLQIFESTEYTGTWQTSANHIPLGRWATVDSAKKALQDWFIEKLGGLGNAK